MSTSLRSRVLRQVPSYYRVEANHVLVILHNGKRIRFGEPGDVWVNPLSEEVAGKLYVGFRKVDITVEVQSMDGLPFCYGVQVYFVFDPRTARSEIRHSLTMQILSAADALQQLVSVILSEPLRERVSMRRALDLIDGEQNVKLSRMLQKQLTVPFKDLGVKLKDTNAINIRSVRGPLALHEAVEWVRFRETLGEGFQLADERLETFLLVFKLVEQLAKSGSSINLFLTQGGGEMLPQQILQQLMATITPGHRNSVAGRPQPKSISPASPVIDHDP